jgi:putative transposase
VILQAVGQAADLGDGPGGLRVREALEPVQPRFPRRQHRWVDTAYRGTFVNETTARLGGSVEVVKHGWTGVAKVWVAPGQEPPEKPTGFHVLPRRWVVERPFGWLGLSRRLSKDYAYLPATSEVRIDMAMSRLMLARLARLAA